MNTVFSALAPVFLLILLGYFLKRRRLVADGFWVPAEKLTYFVFFPALLCVNTATADLGQFPVLPMMAGLVAGILTVAALVMALAPRLGLHGPVLTSVFQGSIRPNTYVGIAVSYALFGDIGLTLVAACIVASVPTVNLLSVAVLARHAGPPGQPAGWRPIAVEVARNPIIMGVLLGVLLNATGVGSPPVVGPLLEILGRASLPIGLMAAGAGLEFAGVRSAGRLVAATATVKLAVLPALTFIAFQALGVGGLTATVGVVYAALPCSASSYVLARHMGGDAVLMAGIITATTLAAMAVLPAVLLMLG